MFSPVGGLGGVCCAATVWMFNCEKKGMCGEEPRDQPAEHVLGQ